MIGKFIKLHSTIRKEFSAEDAMVKDPLAYAVATSVAFGKFRSKNWKVFDTLVMAIKFRTFYTHCRLLIDPRSSIGCFVGLLLVFCLTVVEAQRWATLNLRTGDLAAIYTVLDGVVAFALLC